MTSPSDLQLPVLPVPHARALSLLADSRAEMNEVAEVVESDPALTAAVLRAANSVASASIKRIGSARDSIVRIGLATTRRIVAGAVLDRAFTRLDSAGLAVQPMWEHFLATALLADAAMPGGGGRALAFTAGLLHDVGRLAMAHQDPEKYARVVAAARRGLDALKAERLLFDADHAAWGARVAEAWLVNPEIVGAISDHHVGTAGPVAEAVCRARRVAWSLGIGDGVVPPRAPPLDQRSEDAEVLRALGGAAGLFAHIAWYRGAIMVEM